MHSSFWDTRYQGEDYAYGTEPNDFIRAETHRLPPGRVLCLAEGEGRNAVFLAGLGYEVTAVDFSATGLAKAERLARTRGVSLELVHVDLADYVPPENTFTGVVSVFAHLPATVRRRVHSLAARSLKVGGCLLLEAYAPRQIGLGSGGPKDPALLASLDELADELNTLDLVVRREVEREVHEGTLHTGRAATIQIVGVRR